MAHLMKIAKNSMKTLMCKNKIGCAITAIRNYSSKESNITNDESKIIKSVFISQSNDVFTNLALEDWLYRNIDFNQHHILLLWRNSPCVVIGRHQNPWLEANIDYLAANDIEIARRNSGGGAVYHDKGNLNLTFFTPRERYNRRDNLNMISRALFREWGLNINVSSREDLLLNNHYKVSGTASKLGRPNAYHHCTLLVESNKEHLRNALQKNNTNIKTNATASIPSPISNLKDSNFHVGISKMLTAVGLEYMRTTPLTCQDGGHDRISQQRGFQLVNPTDKWFPGLAEIREQYLSWNWRFGKTPKFQISKSIENPKLVNTHSNLTLDIDKGEIKDITLELITQNFETTEEKAQINANLSGEKYSEDIFKNLSQSLREAHASEEVQQTAVGIA